jgi:transmembrane protein 216
MCVPCAILFAYYLRLQTYVIVLEIVINTFGIVFLALEFLFSLSAFLTFKNYEKTQ